MPSRSILTLVIFLGMLAAFTVINAWMVAPYLLALLMGGILAVLTRPWYQALRRRRVGPRLSAALVVVGLCLGVIIPIALFTTQAIRQGIAFAQSLANSGAFDLERLIARVSSWKWVHDLIGSPDAFESQLKPRIRELGTTLSGGLLAALGSLPNKILQVVLALLTCFFLLIDTPGLQRWVGEKLPLDPDVKRRLSDSFQNTTVGTIWATMAASAVQSAILFVAYLALGVPAAFLAAGTTFLFTWIPLLGSTPVWVAGTIYLWIEGSTTRTILMVIAGLICGISDNFVRPWVLRGRSDLHPLVSLVAIFGGIQVFGLLGVFFGPILTAIFLSLLQVWPLVAERFGLIPSRSSGRDAA